MFKKEASKLGKCNRLSKQMLTCLGVNIYLFSGKARFCRLRRSVLRLWKFLDILLFPPVHPKKKLGESEERGISHLLDSSIGQWGTKHFVCHKAYKGYKGLLIDKASVSSVYSVVKKGSRNDFRLTLFFPSRPFAGVDITGTTGYSSFFSYFILRRQMPVLSISFMSLNPPALHVLLQLPVSIHTLYVLKIDNMINLEEESLEVQGSLGVTGLLFIDLPYRTRPTRTL